jgi:dUTP pyrophosphatase
MSEIKVKKTRASAVVPKRAHPTDAGADLHSLEEIIIQPMERRAVSTGICLEIPEGHYGRVAPRSGLAVRHGIDVLAGVVDSSYRGEIKVVLHNTDKAESFRVGRGDKIAQIIIERHYNLEFREVEDLSETDRGEGGFGSSGK